MALGFWPPYGNTLTRLLSRRGVEMLFVGLVACGVTAHAGSTELRVVAPNAVKEAVSEIALQFEQERGIRVHLEWGGSEAISRRLSGGDVFDVVVNTAQGIDRLIASGKLVTGSRTDFCRSGVGIAVRAGGQRPDISTVESLRGALLSVDSIAISSGASGRYLEQLFQRLGVADEVKPKIKQPPSGAQIGDLLARGEATLGFQQVTELLHAKGVDYLGPLPAAVQHYTVWSAGRHANAAESEAALDFVRALASGKAETVIRRAGMEPM